MASRKAKYNFSMIYKVTYKSGEKLFYANVAADSFAAAIDLWTETGVYEGSVTNIEKTDQRVYHGVNR